MKKCQFYWLKTSLFYRKAFRLPQEPYIKSKLNVLRFTSDLTGLFSKHAQLKII